VLASPAFSVKLYVPFAKPGIALWQKLRGTFFVNSYVKARFLTHDPARIASFEADPLITRPIAVQHPARALRGTPRAWWPTRAITVPTQLLISGSGLGGAPRAAARFFVNLGSRSRSGTC
jgi:alpha-beta hydrolase superfamily lysophospholipase